VAGSGEVVQNFESARLVALDICLSDDDDHDRIGGLIGTRSGSAADYALEVCAAKFPASAVGSPELYTPSAMFGIGET
jgi:hypothetical protein